MPSWMGYRLRRRNISDQVLDELKAAAPADERQVCIARRQARAPILMEILCAAMDRIAMDPGLKPWRMLAATGPSSRPSRNQIGRNLRRCQRQ